MWDDHENNSRNIEQWIKERKRRIKKILKRGWDSWRWTWLLTIRK